MNRLIFFNAFFVNSFLVGFIGLVFLTVKRLFVKKLSCAVTYYISFFILLSAAFPFGSLLSKPLKGAFSKTNANVLKAVDLNTLSSKQILPDDKTANVIFCIWLAVSILLLNAVIIRYIKLVRDINRWKIKLDYKSALLNGVPVYSCKIVSTPMLVGFIRRKLIVPEAFKDDDSLDLICRHEIVHHKRHDILIKTVLIFVCAFNWFDPLLWLLLKDNADDCEASCDLSARKTMHENDKKRYCALLLSLAKRQSNMLLPISSFSSNYKNISRRIDVVMKNDRTKRSSAVWLFSFICVLLAFVTIVTAYNTPLSSNELAQNKDNISAQNNASVNGNESTPKHTQTDGDEITYKFNDEKVAYEITVDDDQNTDRSVDIVTFN